MNPTPWHAAFEEQLGHWASLSLTDDEWSPKPPAQNVVNVARSLVDKIWRGEIPAPALTAAADGSIHVKWRKGSRQFSVMIMPDEIVEYCFVQDGQVLPEDGKLIPEDFGRVNEFLGWLLVG